MSDHVTLGEKALLKNDAGHTKNTALGYSAGKSLPAGVNEVPLVVHASSHQSLFSVRNTNGVPIMSIGEQGFDDSTLDILAQQLAGRLMPPEVVVKCVACGQYGAVKHPCRHCGSPIDPLELDKRGKVE